MLTAALDLATDQLAGLALVAGSLTWLGIHWVRHGWVVGGDS